MSKAGLFDTFSAVSSEQWNQKIKKDLKGVDYDDTLVWESSEGIRVQPFYHSDDSEQLDLNAHVPTWNIGQTIAVLDATIANTQAKNALKRGAESLHLLITSTSIDIKELLIDIDNSAVLIYLELHFIDTKYVKTVVDFSKNTLCKIHLNIDPIGYLVRTGNWYFNAEKDQHVLEEILALEMEDVVCIDLTSYQNAGANRVQQLGYALAHANEYLNMLSKPGQQLVSVSFKVAIGSNYFFEIAKLRALRWLWRSIAEQYNIKQDCHIIAIPTRRNKTLYDYNVNMLRSTTEAMSGVLGGANTICNLPYDAIYHKENDFGTRIALNQLLLLKNESYFDKVANAADGTYYLESLTEELAEKALQLFKDIEKAGGFLSQLESGVIQKEIAQSADKEQIRFNEGKEVLVGTNKYQNLNDKMKQDVEIDPFAKQIEGSTLITPIIGKRLAEKLEQNRLSDE